MSDEPTRTLADRLADALCSLADDLTGNYIDVGDDFYGPTTDWDWMREAAEALRDAEHQHRADLRYVLTWLDKQTQAEFRRDGEGARLWRLTEER